ncbi:MAG: hypothetical protein HRU41_10155 [Saprospiraceae bacterium]|nr:hypothetical protein [Saprospiraceae bacterium]
MIKLLILTFCAALLNPTFSQEKDNKCNIKPFEVYLDDEDEFSNIRATPGGQIVLKLNNQYAYGYILHVIDFQDGWLKIDEINGIDGYRISEFEGWVHTSIVALGTTYNIDVLDEPNGTTKVGQVLGEQDTFKIKEVHCEWIKIECKGITGWIESDKTCGNPVTTCP